MMTKFDFKVLNEIAAPGSQPDLCWGAAMGASLELLVARGYVTRIFNTITQLGRDVLAAQSVDLSLDNE